MSEHPAPRPSTRASEVADIAALADPTAWAPAAARLLANLGFSLIHSDTPAAPGGAQLLVAFRASPSLRHFDPEVLSYWAASEGRGREASFDRRKPVPAELAVAWGRVRVLDRLQVDNRFLTFGGTLRAVALDADLTVASLASPGPLARWSGHSQGLDPLVAEIGAFFGRLMVQVDFTVGAERRLADTPPIQLYAAFIRDAHARLVAAESLREADPSFSNWVTAEAGRLEAHEPEAWAAGGSLSKELDLRR
jgi:hypothetical protein